MSKTYATPLERVSDRAFGGKHTLRIMLLIMDIDGGLTYQKELIRLSGLSPATIADTLDDLCEVGMMTRLPNAGSQFKYFQRRDDQLGWSWALQLRDAFGQQSVPEASRERFH